jgi:hypothetical protein
MPPCRLRFAGLVEPLPSVLSYRLQKPVPRLALPAGHEHQRLIDKVREQIQDVVPVYPSTRADLLGRGKREPPREGREPPENHTLLFEEKIIAPAYRRP